MQNSTAGTIANRKEQSVKSLQSGQQRVKRPILLTITGESDTIPTDNVRRRKKGC